MCLSVLHLSHFVIQLIVGKFELEFVLCYENNYHVQHDNTLPQDHKYQHFWLRYFII